MITTLPPLPTSLRSRRLLGEEPLDIESPLSRENKTYTGAEVIPLQFNAKHKSVLLAAAREIFSAEEQEREKVSVNVAAGSDGPSVDARVRKIGHRNKAKVATLLAGAATLAALYAARRVIVPS